jgi:hypothetical protein
LQLALDLLARATAVLQDAVRRVTEALNAVEGKADGAAAAPASRAADTRDGEPAAIPR